MPQLRLVVGHRSARSGVPVVKYLGYDGTAAIEARDAAVASRHFAAVESFQLPRGHLRQCPGPLQDLPPAVNEAAATDLEALRVDLTVALLTLEDSKKKLDAAQEGLEEFDHYRAETQSRLQGLTSESAARLLRVQELEAAAASFATDRAALEARIVELEAAAASFATDRAALEARIVELEAAASAYSEAKQDTSPATEKTKRAR